MRFGFNYGLLGRGSGVVENACMSNMQTDGTWNGHIAGSGSTMDPADTVSGLPVYEFKWDATDTTGNVEFSLGVAGDEQEPNANDVIIIKDNISMILSWDDTAKAYIGSDLEATTYFNEGFMVGEEGCFTIAYLPVLLIHYDFAELQIGAKV